MWSAYVVGAEPVYPANPALEGGTVYLSEQGIVAFDLEHRQPLWSALTGEWTDAPVALGDIVLVGSSRGLYALAAEDGRIRWHLATRSRLFSPVVSDGIAYAGSEEGLLRAVEVATGELQWQRSFPGWVYSPAVSGSQLVTGGQSHRLYALEAESGELRWERPLNQELVHHPVALEDGKVIVTTFAGEVMVVAGESGRLHWYVRDTVANLSAMVGQDRLFFNTFGGWLKARRPSDGALLWAVRLQEPEPSTVEEDGSWVWTYDGSGSILTLDASTGQLVWQTPVSGAPIGGPVVVDDHILVFTAERWSDSLRLVVCRRVDPEGEGRAVSLSCEG